MMSTAVRHRASGARAALSSADDFAGFGICGCGRLIGWSHIASARIEAQRRALTGPIVTARAGTRRDGASPGTVASIFKDEDRLSPPRSISGQ
jgi:hypothetical protein